MSRGNFTRVLASFGRCWKHNSAPIWIAHYSAVDGVRAEFWQTYIAVVPVPKGRDPWSCDNRRIGPINGYKTLEAAMEAASAAAAEQVAA